jgi:bifunctional UDP-N-acetylglucosamine pyrophosphorylase/glucosamine-1-phosphate N-acetyltransferase
VAPVTIGDGAFTAAGSVITEDVPAGALGIARGKQHNSAGWVERRHAGSASAEAAARARDADTLPARHSEPGGSPGADHGLAREKGPAQAEDEGAQAQ